MRYLGIDYGKKKIGLSFSEGIFASPYKSLVVHSLAEAVNQIESVIKKELVDCLVIGVAESGESYNLVKKFIKEMEGKLEIKEVPETLSTYQAGQDLITMGVSRSQRRNDDAQAATIILQQYLDSLAKNE